MPIIRQVNNCSLIENKTHSKTLRYYVDNGIDVSEYFDEHLAKVFLDISNQYFEKKVNEYFNPSVKLLWSKEQVENLIFDFAQYHHIASNKEELDDLNNWIKENIYKN